MDLMMDHIADHLQVLALLTLRLSTENLADGEIHAISSSQAPSDEQGSGKRGSLDGESEIFFEEDMIQEIDQDASLVEMSQIDVTIPDVTWPEDEWTATRLKDLREETSSPDPILLHLCKRQFARPTKWALLIACPYGKLEGPINDVKSMHALLERHGFEVVLCCGIEAVRDTILNSWNELISKMKEGDTVVVYYSGFGGMAELTEADARVWAGYFRQYQFIVPVDYSPDVSGQFRGILDVEISALVRRTTDITENVTIIFDCGHSGRIARDPWHNGTAVPKNLPHVYHKELFKHLQWLRSQGIDVQNYGGLERNKLAVRVVAAADSETSWEYVDEHGRSGGALTKALVPILDQALKANASWKDVIARVCEQVNCRFPRQNPQAEGPHIRLIFSTATTNSSPINVTEEDGDSFIRWPAAFPNELEPFMGRLVESRFLKPIEKENDPIVFAHIRKCENSICVYNASEFKYGSFIFESKGRMQDSVERAIELAERFARANRIFTLRASNEEMLEHELHVNLLNVSNSTRGHPIPLDGTGEIAVGDKVYVDLSNPGAKPIFVTVFKISVVGEVVHLSRKSPYGIRLLPSQERYEHTLEQRPCSSKRLDAYMTWPKGLPKDLQGPIPESFVCIVTDRPTDLRDLALQRPENRSGSASSLLEKRAYQLAYGESRGISAEDHSRERDYGVLK
ncbi:uncharacterized protein TRIVIDRAFT_206799 [Trichoderma virens Gv29-8]|uniref:Peptidase C14 caspase domain-containing protein n=1 Tax=Hypocrea virens (strain Gv29-8 / FGSC 10586) TaxID=413071 RepID=G9NBE2_HYPVG|nr:uncharacterized protein TRIVIDRAFT_206799 [Trichoderma virens Gv29-8]EHK16147.1 hypothetical protein TRIVIDRAFT_206799 [Trichoderma virens Gv29-8]